MDSDSVPARVALGITTVLAMTTLMFGVQSALPKVPYMKAVDLFLAFSFICVFAALVEFAAVNYQLQTRKKLFYKRREKGEKCSEKNAKELIYIAYFVNSIIFILHDLIHTILPVGFNSVNS